MSNTIALIATGGTIAGQAAQQDHLSNYRAAELNADTLLDNLPPAIRQHANIVTSQPYAIDSRDSTPQHWLNLAQHVLDTLSSPHISAAVITHGTDSMEETACFLDAVLPRHKAVILTGAMRPANALSADGPLNLCDAIRTAAEPHSQGRGVLLCFGRKLFRGKSICKIHTQSPEAFASFSGDIVGYLDDQSVHYHMPPLPMAQQESQASKIMLNHMPRVDIVYVAPGMPPDILKAYIDAGAKALVLLLPGNGSVPESWHTTIQTITQQGISIIRASRCNAGPVSPSPLDSMLGTQAAGNASATTCRIQLMIELATETSA